MVAVARVLWQRPGLETVVRSDRFPAIRQTGEGGPPMSGSTRRGATERNSNRAADGRGRKSTNRFGLASKDAAGGASSEGGGAEAPGFAGVLARVGQPIHVLVFVAPLILLYEVGLALLLPRHPELIANLAHDTILRFMAIFGTGVGLSLPGILLLAILVVWQILSRTSWKPDWRVPPWMVLESFALAMPLVVVGHLIARALPAAGVEAEIGSLDLWSKIVISLGAGLYEELLFRMALILGLHTLLVDVGRASSRVGTIVAVIVSAVAFAAYHPLAGTDGAISWARLTFFLVAGLHFGAIFVTRGFGIAVGTHVAYDVIVATMLLRGE